MRGHLQQSVLKHRIREKAGKTKRWWSDNVSSSSKIGSGGHQGQSIVHFPPTPCVSKRASGT